MKVMMIEKVYLKLRIANGIVGYIQNILITKSQWIQKDHLMHLTTNVFVALDKFIQKCDTLQNITSLGLPKNVILILPISRTCQYHQYIIKSNISKTFNIGICQLPLAFTFCQQIPNQIQTFINFSYFETITQQCIN